MAARVVHYQAKDADVVDYRIYFRSDCNIGFRGPRVPDHLNTKFGVALGSAGVFGRFAHQPFSEQLTAAGFPTLNLGISGARPQVYQTIGQLPKLLESASFVIIEFMSARGYSLDFFKTESLASNMGRYVPPGASDSDAADRDQVFVDLAWSRALRDYSPSQLNAFIAASRASYVEGMKALIDMVGGKLLFLWLSKRPPIYAVNLETVAQASGGFPHFIDAEVLSQVLAYARASKGTASRYVEVVSSKGLPAVISNRFNGRPEPAISAGPNGSSNNYYASQEMHDEAALNLLTALSEMESGSADHQII
jgi:hypothetical protein